MSAEEYGLWMADYSAEQWGDVRMDVGFAVVASTLVNLQRKAGSAPFPLSDFMPFKQQHNEDEDVTTAAEFIKGLEKNG